jgi:FdhD protein
MEAARRRTCTRWENGSTRPVDAQVIVEASVALAVNGERWLELLCTPRDLEALAVGFLYNESVIAGRDAVHAVSTHGRDDLVDVRLTHPAERPPQWRRTSGYGGGVTAGSGGVAAPEDTPVDDGGLTLQPEDIAGLVTKLLAAQRLYPSTGGVHTSALADGREILLAMEDIGRHNTFDKLVGRCLLDGISARRGVLVTTGRVSSEMVQKAARFGVAVVISLTSPTALAIELAERRGITLIGYARSDRFDVYAGTGRIVALT